MESRIVYFEKPGRENTDAVMEIAKKRADIGDETRYPKSMMPSMSMERSTRMFHRGQKIPPNIIWRVPRI